MIESVALPEGFADLPPGPELCTMLAGLDQTRLSNFDTVVVAQAVNRLAGLVEAWRLTATAQVAHRSTDLAAATDVVRTAHLGQPAIDELACALTWTRRTAGNHVDLSWQAIERLPALHAALSAGAVDLPKVRVIADAVRSLDDATARAVVDQVLGRAGGWTTTQLRRRLRTLVLRADPAAARKAKARGEADRRVDRYVDHDGTVTLTALGLPVERAAKAMQRVEALALTIKRGGDGRTMDQLRADTVLDLLDGTFAGPRPASRPGVVDLIVPLATVAGASEEPGDLPGWGPVLADVARKLALDPDADTEWRVSVIDDDGRLVGAVDTTRRPSPHQPVRPRRPGRDRPGRSQPDKGGSGSGRRLVDGRLVDGRVVDGVDPRRFPNATQKRHVRARDRECRMPGCTRAARWTDLDHTIAWIEGGPTLIHNLGLLCRTHHVLKHLGGWHLDQPQPGEFTWTTALGHTYTRGEEHPHLDPDAVKEPPPQAAPDPADPGAGADEAGADEANLDGPADLADPAAPDTATDPDDGTCPF